MKQEYGFLKNLFQKYLFLFDNRLNPVTTKLEIVFRPAVT